MTKSTGLPDNCWSIPVRLHDVPEAGLKVGAVADAATRECVAKLAGVDAVLRLEACFDVARRGPSGLAVSGNVVARVRQTCVLTLEPVENDIDEPVAATFAAGGAAAIPEVGETIVATDEDDPPEPLVDSRADLGRLATEFLVLAVDKYPRKPGAEYRPTVVGDAGGSPFDALAVLKKDHNRTS
jgi:hypothetical protein